MRDVFGRKIDYMRISITDRCNLRCRYCMPDGIEQVDMAEILTYEEILAVCKAAVRAGVTKFKVTGGEPLVRLGCVDFIGDIYRIPGVEQVTITTNGVLLADCAEKLYENGLRNVNVSLDTLSREKYKEITGRDKFDQVIMGIETALQIGLNVKVNTVLQTGMNDDEWPDLVELTRKYPVDVRFIELMPIGLGKKMDGIFNDDLLEKLKQREPGLVKDNSIHGNGPAVYYRLPDAQGSVGFISAMHGKFCADCNRIRLTSMGKLKPCLCYSDTIDVKEALRSFSGQEREEQVYKAVQLAIGTKPQQHSFEHLSEITESRQMSQIGG